ncbi:MAG TPA: peptidylprolyl isomerase [Anaerolineae bacterium]|nr:peptidylprolyl isomerase [Anaerolineae bacterium]
MLACCLLALGTLLAACSGGGQARPTPSGSEGEQAGVVSTVALATQAPTAVPTATATPTITPTPTPPAPLAAQVNGQYIFLTDYERRVAQYEQALAEQGLDPAQAREEVLAGLIDGALIQQGAAALGIQVGDEELDRQVEADIEAGGGQEAFDEWLEATGQTREDYREMLRQSLVSQRAMEAVTADVPLEAEQVHARHIQVESEEAALEILGQLQQGADFATLARERSTDLATRDNGGDLGWFPRGMVAPELENAAFALQPGEVSDVLLLGEGYHLIQVVERETARALPPEMQIELQQAAFERWLAELRAAATIVRFAAE